MNTPPTACPPVADPVRSVRRLVRLRWAALAFAVPGLIWLLESPARAQPTDETVTGNLFVNGGNISPGNASNLSLLGGSNGAGITLGQGTTSGSITLTPTGTGRVEARDRLAITNTAGFQRLLMGNQDSGGANKPAIVNAANGAFYFGYGDSWAGGGGTLTTTVTLLGDGNVGIGTSTPVSKLELQDGTQRLLFHTNKRLSGDWPPVTEATTMTIQASGSSAGNLAFATGNNEVMRVASNGKVGIGTLTPGFPLSVHSAETYQLFLRQEGSGSAAYTVLRLENNDSPGATAYVGLGGADPKGS